MKNFLKIASGISVNQLTLELHQHPELWNQNDVRLRPGTPHVDSDDIWLRFNDETPFIKAGSYAGFTNEHNAVWYPAFYSLPSARALIFDLCRRVEAERIGGILIWRLKPGHRIHPHQDHGWHADYYDKFNVCLQAQPGCSFDYLDESESMQQQTGDVHRFLNSSTHSVVNNSSDDFIVMCVCLKTHNYAERFQPLPPATGPDFAAIKLQEGE